MSCWNQSLPGISRAFGQNLRTKATASTWSGKVSSYGRICSPHGAISYGAAQPSGYFRVRMSGADLLVHRVVALSFLGPARGQDAWQVHHKDGNPGNNNTSNLEYVTSSENASHSHASGTRRCSGPTRSKPVMYRARCSKTLTSCKLSYSQGCCVRTGRFAAGSVGFLP